MMFLFPAKTPASADRAGGARAPQEQMSRESFVGFEAQIVKNGDSNLLTLTAQ